MIRLGNSNPINFLAMILCIALSACLMKDGVEIGDSTSGLTNSNSNDPSNPNNPSNPNRPLPENRLRHNLIFEAMFEGNNPFFGTQYNSNGTTTAVDMDAGGQHCCSDSIVQSSNAYEGNSSACFVVRKDDPRVSSGYRAELRPFSDDSGEKWYGYSIYFEAPQANGLWKDDWNAVYTQWHPDNSDGSSNLAQWGDPHVMISTNPTGAHGATDHNTGVQITSLTWHRVVWHVNWDTGHIQFYWDGTLIYDQTVGHFTGQYMKIGMNTWGPTGDAPDHDRKLCMDAFRIGDENATYDDVAP